jgi:hypothetical protein
MACYFSAASGVCITGLARDGYLYGELGLIVIMTQPQTNAKIQHSKMISWAAMYLNVQGGLRVSLGLGW